jgi:hypothetical protein
VKSGLKREVQDLVWAVVDEYATESQISRLEHLVTTNEEARRTYITCMQMHADLCLLLGSASFEPKLPKAAPLGRKKTAKSGVVLPAGIAEQVAPAMC